MVDGFTFMYVGLAAIFSLLFLNLLAAKICDSRRRRSQASQVTNFEWCC